MVRLFVFWDVLNGDAEKLILTNIKDTEVPDGTQSPSKISMSFLEFEINGGQRVL